MCLYNYIHIWRAARNVKNPPANNYGPKSRAVPVPFLSLNEHSGTMRVYRPIRVCCTSPFTGTGSWT